MGVKIGNLDISAFKVGSADCAIYLGDVKLYPSEEPSSLKWVTFNYGDDISGLDIYGVSGISEDLADTFGGGDIQFTPSRTDIECNIGYCYGDTFARGEIVELIFSELGCNDYYNSSATNVEGGTIQLYIYD